MTSRIELETVARLARGGQNRSIRNCNAAPKLKQSARQTKRITQYTLLFFLITSLAAKAADKPPTWTVNTELVQVSVVALDQEGRVATGLAKQDFEVFEDGVKQDIMECMNETSPVSAALVLDKSRSMKSNLPLVVQGAFNVLDTHIKKDDEFLLVAFDNAPKLISPRFISDVDTLKHLIATNLVEAKGLTALFDALHLAVSTVIQQAKNVRRAAIVITDGGDNHSAFTKKKILQYLQEADVPVFAINATEPNIFHTWSVGKNGKPELVLKDENGPIERGGPKILNELTSATGGAVFTAHEPGDLPRILGVLYDLISNEYTLTYKPPSSGYGSHHQIQVKLAATDHKFDGYHLDYKHQYYRAVSPPAATNTLAVLPVP